MHFLVVLTVGRQCFCKGSELTRSFFFGKTNPKVTKPALFGRDGSAYPNQFKKVDKNTAKILWCPVPV